MRATRRAMNARGSIVMAVVCAESCDDGGAAMLTRTVTLARSAASTRHGASRPRADLQRERLRAPGPC